MKKKIEKAEKPLAPEKKVKAKESEKTEKAVKEVVKPVKAAKPVVKKQAKAKGPAKEPTLSLSNLKAPSGAHKSRRVLGRGPSSGHGKTSSRGSKGQTSRAGRHFYPGFEGGQSPLIRKIPKRGFTSNFKKEYQIVNLKDLNKIKELMINPGLLEEKGLIKNKEKLIKILGEGEINNAVTIQAHAFSKRAGEAIKAAGGKIEILSLAANIK